MVVVTCNISCSVDVSGNDTDNHNSGCRDCGINNGCSDNGDNGGVVIVIISINVSENNANNNYNGGWWVIERGNVFLKLKTKFTIF